MISTTIPHEWIDWSADEHRDFVAEDFDWISVATFPIKEFCSEEFIESMKTYLDQEISSALSANNLNPSITPHEAREAGIPQLADWIQLDQDLAEGLDIEKPICVAMVDSNDELPRQSICEGWHRLSASIKHGKKSIPAYVGRLKRENWARVCSTCDSEMKVVASHRFAQGNGCDADVDTYQCTNCDDLISE